MLRRIIPAPNPMSTFFEKYFGAANILSKMTDNPNIPLSSFTLYFA